MMIDDDGDAVSVYRFVQGSITSPVASSNQNLVGGFSSTYIEQSHFILAD